MTDKRSTWRNKGKVNKVRIFPDEPNLSELMGYRTPTDERENDMSDIEKYYIPRGLGNRIKSVVVERETEASIWKNGKRYEKAESYFDTWEGAKGWLLKRAERELRSARRDLQLAQSHHGNIKGLRQDK